MTIEIKAQAYRGVAATFDKVLNLFGESGQHWGRGYFKRRQDNGDFRYCLVGAIDEVTRFRPFRRRDARRVLQMAVTPHYLKERADVYEVFLWNDRHDRTFAEVEALIRGIMQPDS